MDFDLTTKEGTEKANNWAGKTGGAIAAYVALGGITTITGFGAASLIGPVGVIGYGLYKLGQKVFSADEAVKKQIEAAEELIKTGKEQGVKKMKIKVSSETGVHFDMDIPEVKIKTSFGGKGDMELEVEYF